MNSGIRPSGVSLLVYTDGYMPTDRKTEIYSDHAVDGVYSIAINVHNFHEGNMYGDWVVPPPAGSCTPRLLLLLTKLSLLFSDMVDHFKTLKILKTLKTQATALTPQKGGELPQTTSTFQHRRFRNHFNAQLFCAIS